jgi:hypothetical protein
MSSFQRDETSRRLLMPELLESRNAPGALFPLPAVFGAFVTDLGGDEQLNIESLYRPTAETTYYRSDSLPTSATLLVSSESLANVLREAESHGRLTQTTIDIARQATVFRSPTQLLAVNAAFESYSLNDLNLVPINPQLPPPVIQPIEPPDSQTPDDQSLDGTDLPSDSGANTDTTPPVTTTDPASETPPLVTQPVITDPESEHNQPNNATDVLTPPPVIQPVITDPESEHNQPSPEAETPPPLIQPVIMDPESEHNRE